MSLDLSTTYLGLHLRSPLVASAGPLTRSLDWLLQLEAAGAGAVVLPSLFEEQLVAESQHIDTLVGDLGAGFAGKAAGIGPIVDSRRNGSLMPADQAIRDCAAGVRRTQELLFGLPLRCFAGGD